AEPEGAGPLLKTGAKGDAVSKLQARLKELGFDPGGIDGVMGPNTVAAVKKFQASKGLDADGIVGPATWKKLGIRVDGAVSYNNASPSESSSAVDVGGPQPAVRRQGKLIGAGIAKQFDAMVAAAKADGVDLQIVSGYRTHAEQQALCDANPNPMFVARPGTSNHEKGNAIDYLDSPGAWSWLKRNSTRFGFYNYPAEAWHYSLDGH
ncbi:MAG TPA: peptidoglycan-binding protein, partial [Chroococcales cyanobacterium]